MLVAEETFIELRKLADEHKDIDSVAITHSDKEHTVTWVKSVGSGKDIKAIANAEIQLYGQWGLTVSSACHILSRFSLWNVYALGKKDAIWNIPMGSGSRW
ncbi:hypothetical protein BJ878DRAFT_210324 [Calycina marina]|uniref:Uncharacterized protein n=1 Tax=Calycina marina TaxID=1763456 RepID=A0A9P8CHT6_9HELO|nr:hypothetical protein BJ878DRAFT_210324 [Calycina marina]